MVKNQSPLAACSRGRWRIWRGPAVEREAVDGVLVVGADHDGVVEVGVAHLVLGDGAEGDVLLGRGGEAGPLRVAVTDDQLAVGQEEEQAAVGVPEAGLHLQQGRVADRAHALRSGPEEDSDGSSDSAVFGMLASTSFRRRPRSAYDWISR